MSRIYELAPGADTGWVDMRGRRGEMALAVTIPNGGAAVLEIAWDEALPTKVDARVLEIFTNTTVCKFPSPFPDFLRGRNTGAVAGVKFAFGQSEGANGHQQPASVQTQEYGA